MDRNNMTTASRDSLYPAVWYIVSAPQLERVNIEHHRAGPCSSLSGASTALIRSQVVRATLA